MRQRNAARRGASVARGSMSTTASCSACWSASAWSRQPGTMGARTPGQDARRVRSRRSGHHLRARASQRSAAAYE